MEVNKCKNVVLWSRPMLCAIPLRNLDRLAAVATEANFSLITLAALGGATGPAGEGTSAAKRIHFQVMWFNNLSQVSIYTTEFKIATIAQINYCLFVLFSALDCVFTMHHSIQQTASFLASQEHCTTWWEMSLFAKGDVSLILMMMMILLRLSMANRFTVFIQYRKKIELRV